MNEVMQHILLLSAVGSILALVLLCIKPLTKRLFTPKWQYYIWLTVLIVMVLPVKLSLPVEPVQITPAENTSAQTQQITPVQTQQEPAQPATLEEIAQRPALRIPDIPNAIVRISGFLWLAVAALLLGYRMTKYMMFLRTIKKHSVTERSLENIPKRLTVRKTELLDAPLIVGLIKPVLYLPQTEIKEEELDYILLHELTHYRRHDLLYKWFAMLVSSIHWFNPFVYIVSRQIDEECEMSCDYAVCKTLTEPQKKDYMAMILDFVQTSIRKKRPLTTQMASSKKILKRRFLMMKTKKATSKFVSVLSVVLALAMLSTTVFASGVLSGLTEDNYTIEITNNGEVIRLVNKPFIENGEVYVPLREIFEKVGVVNNQESYINWNEGKIEALIVSSNEDKALYSFEIGNDVIKTELMPPSKVDYFPDVKMNGVAILKDSVTYISIKDIDFMVNNISFSAKSHSLSYAIYDKNGNDITSSVDNEIELQKDSEKMTTPYGTVELVFKSFYESDFEKMKGYCTENCVDKFFEDSCVFGMKKATIRSMSYTNGSSEISDRVFIEVSLYEIEFEGNSVFAEGRNPTSFYLILQRQTDGRYLIDEFATGL